MMWRYDTLCIVLRVQCSFCISLTGGVLRTSITTKCWWIDENNFIYVTSCEFYKFSIIWRICKCPKTRQRSRHIVWCGKCRKTRIHKRLHRNRMSNVVHHLRVRCFALLPQENLLEKVTYIGACIMYIMSFLNQILISYLYRSLILLLCLCFLLGWPLPKSLRLRRFESDLDKIWQIVCSSTPHVNTHRLTESDFGYDVILSRRRPWCHFAKSHYLRDVIGWLYALQYLIHFVFVFVTTVCTKESAAVDFEIIFMTIGLGMRKKWNFNVPGQITKLASFSRVCGSQPLIINHYMYAQHTIVIL